MDSAPAIKPIEVSLAGVTIGSYTLIRPIGHGGMGIIYEAIHDEIGRHAAIKMMSPRFVDEPRYVRRFLNEARTISRVRHPGLVQIYSQAAQEQEASTDGAAQNGAGEEEVVDAEVVDDEKTS